MDREQRLIQWVGKQGALGDGGLVPVSGDASFRRYFRLLTQQGSRIVMDAPPEHEDCRPFVQMAQRLQQAGVNVPEVLAWDQANGFMMLTDFGDRSYLEAFKEAQDSQRISALMADAFAMLLRVQCMAPVPDAPRYDRTLLQREVDLFPVWYVQGHLEYAWSADDQAMWQRTVLDTLLPAVERQPVVWVHRDYHSRNLMVTDPNPGVLDFQDALMGPVTYDAVSLLKDAYFVWEEEQRLDWLVRYWEKARHARIPVASDFGVFYRDFEWMGVQRHLKVIGIFARLARRDGKPGYLQDIPRVADYLLETCRRYRELQPLALWLEQCWAREQQIGYTF
ncbi:MAG: phosphotransferase [Betaproteobacteria bacterium]|nr:phosphotransferase [Betaproteobacteria bacterium]